MRFSVGLLVVCQIGLTTGHGAVTIPKPRQAIDGSIHPWNGTVPQSGQACFWFNNGCDISCDKCDGVSGQMVEPRYIYTGPAEPPSWSGEGIVHDPSQPIEHVFSTRPDGSHRKSICKNP
eukprot:gene18606-15200_t